MTYNKLYHYTTEKNLESIKTSQTIDCRKDCREVNERAFEPIVSHLCCTTKKQCNYEFNRINNVKIVILELLVPTTINFEQIDHGQRRRMELQPGHCYIVSTNPSRIEYLISCEIATSLLKTHKIKYVVIDKNTPHGNFRRMQFTDIAL